MLYSFELLAVIAMQAIVFINSVVFVSAICSSANHRCERGRRGAVATVNYQKNDRAFTFNVTGQHIHCAAICQSIHNQHK